MDENKSHSGGEIAAKLARHAKAAYDIVQGYAAANIAGAAVAIVKNYLPEIITICVALIIIPIVVFICLPAMLLDYSPSADESTDDILNNIYSIFNESMEEFMEKTNEDYLDGIITSEEAYDADEVIISDKTEVSDGQMNLYWFAAIHSVYHQNKIENMSDDEIKEFAQKMFSYDFDDTVTAEVEEQRVDSEGNSYTYKIVYVDRTLIFSYDDPNVFMKKLDFTDEQIEWATIMYETMSGGSVVIDGTNFISPVPYDWHNYVSSEFGYRTDPVTGKVGNMHSGIDIAVPEGTDIYAVQSGTVTAVVYGTTGYGYYVKINHGEYETMYSHNSDNLVEIGDEVIQGQIIAEVGSTGKSTGPHLHFELRIGGKATNPRPYLP